MCLTLPPTWWTAQMRWILTRGLQLRSHSALPVPILGWFCCSWKHGKHPYASTRTACMLNSWKQRCDFIFILQHDQIHFFTNLTLEVPYRRKWSQYFGFYPFNFSSYIAHHALPYPLKNRVADTSKSAAHDHRNFSLF